MSVTTGLFIAMQLNPEAQRTAQAELDTVIGPDRLPKLADRSYLPYMNALVKELFRWHNALPTCMPSRSFSQRK